MQKLGPYFSLFTFFGRYFSLFTYPWLQVIYYIHFELHLYKQWQAFSFDLPTNFHLKPLKKINIDEFVE